MLLLQARSHLYDLVTKWQEEYIDAHLDAGGDKENWPLDRTETEWMEDFQAWLQCKGYAL